MVDELAFTGATSNSIFLGWTATGDDGEIGTASAYEAAAPWRPSTTATSPRPPWPPEAGPWSIGLGGVVGGPRPGPGHGVLRRAEDAGRVGECRPAEQRGHGHHLATAGLRLVPGPVQRCLLRGRCATRTLAIQNTGVGTRDWKVPLPGLSGPGVAQHACVDLGSNDNGNIGYEYDGARLIIQCHDVRRFGISFTTNFRILLYPPGKIVHPVPRLPGRREARHGGHPESRSG